MQQSNSIKELATALSKVQGQLTFAKKDNANPFFKSKYADLASVWDSCRTLLSDNGLAVIQFPSGYATNVVDDKTKEHLMSLTTILTHSSGEWISQDMTVPVTKADAQGAGSALTYMRRYALAAVVGVYQDDDDGNAASKPVKFAEKPTLVAISIPMHPAQLGQIEKLIAETETDASKILTYYKKTTLDQLNTEEADQVISSLQKKLIKE
jgi:hypothetical protein